jgi:hypothetical protein
MDAKISGIVSDDSKSCRDWFVTQKERLFSEQNDTFYAQIVLGRTNSKLDNIWTRPR